MAKKTTTTNEASTIGTCATLSPSIAAGIGRRLDQSIKEEIEFRNRQNVKQRRSRDLEPLTGEYEKMKKHLRKLIEFAQKYHRNSIELNLNRVQMVGEIAEMASFTPFHDQVVSESAKKRCLVNVYNLASIQSSKDVEKFQKEILDYLIEWENIVIPLIDTKIKECNELKTTKVHYEEKYITLRQQYYDYKNKKKEPPESFIDKLQRNKIKFKAALENYEDLAFELVILLEEAVICSWKDLFPVVVSMMEWDADRAYAEYTVLKNLKSKLLDDIKQKLIEFKDYKAVRSSSPRENDDLSSVGDTTLHNVNLSIPESVVQK